MCMLPLVLMVLLNVSVLRVGRYEFLSIFVHVPMGVALGNGVQIVHLFESMYLNLMTAYLWMYVFVHV